MEDIYYLVHSTNNSNFSKWNELKVSPDENSFIYTEDDQFPGVYFSLVTKQNIDYISLYPGKYILFFSRDLMLQQNYHINFRDHNGMITEKNTYYPWNLDKFLQAQNKLIEENKIKGKKTRFDSEVVFHDNISFKYLCNYIEKPTLPKFNTKDYKNESEYIEKTKENITSFLPRSPLICGSIDSDIIYRPFYCYPFEDTYPVRTAFESSSKKWLEMMAQMCGVTVLDDDNIETIRKKIRLVSKDLYQDRYKQKIDLLKNYKGGKKRKTQRHNIIKKNKKVGKINNRRKTKKSNKKHN